MHLERASLARCNRSTRAGDPDSKICCRCCGKADAANHKRGGARVGDDDGLSGTARSQELPRKTQRTRAHLDEGTIAGRVTLGAVKGSMIRDEIPCMIRDEPPCNQYCTCGEERGYRACARSL